MQKKWIMGSIIIIICSLIFIPILTNKDNEHIAKVDRIEEETNGVDSNDKMNFEVINIDNWISHPQIIEIRSIYNEIQSSIESGKFNKDIKKNQYSEPFLPTFQSIYRDNGLVKKYTEECGSDDSYISKECFYDKNKILRFMLIKCNAVNGTVIEHRIYFDLNGKRLWEIQELIEGPGYTFPEVWPDEDIIKDPFERFKSKKD